MQKQLKTILIGMWVIAGLTVGGVAAGVWWYRQKETPVVIRYESDPAEAAEHHLDALFDAPTFSLTDQDGKTFRSDQLRGKVWVADFVFTTCTSLCPVMTQQMAEFQKKTPGSRVQMVSFSVDPEHDTPAILKTYADATKADLSRWHFLTGDKETIWNISTAMKLPAGPQQADHQVMHSSHFLLVDGNSHIRGVYDYKDAGFLAKLVADANTLVTEGTSH